MTVPSDLINEINTQLPTNNANQITATILRGVLIDMVNAAGGGTFTTTDGTIIVGQDTFQNKTASTDYGIQLGGFGRLLSGLFTEVNGELLSCAINVPEIGDRDDTVAGCILKLDTRAADPVFSVWAYPASSGSTPSLIFSVDLTTTAAAKFLGAPQPTVNDGAALGTNLKSWSDLYLASGGIINWNDGDILITHSANALTVTGGEFSALVTATGGTAQRTLQSHFADTIFAKDYGVIADNTTDDTAALQAAIDATPTNGTLVLPQGFCRVIGSGSNCLTIVKEIAIVGQGWDSGIRADATVPNTRDILSVIPTIASRGFLFRDFRISNSSSGRHALKLDGSSATIIYNIYIERMLIDATAGGNSIYGTGAATSGVLAYSSIRDCNVESIKVDTGGDGLEIISNVISAVGSNQGISVDQVPGAGGLNIKDNVITATAGMILIERGYPVIDSNEFEQFQNNTNANGAMIDLNGGSGSGVAACKITNNTISVNAGITGVTAPIRVAAAQGTRINGNKFSTRGSSHIVVTAAAADTVIGKLNEYATNDVLVNLALTDAGTRTQAISSFGGTIAVKTAALQPFTNDGAPLGSLSNEWSDLYLASGAVINFASSDVLITHAANGLLFSGASSGYLFDAAVAPSSNDGAPLGSGLVSWSDLFLAAGGVINWNAGGSTITEASGRLSFSTSNIGIGIAAANTVGIFYAGTITGGNDSAAIQISPTITSVAATTNYGLAIAPFLAAGSATVTNFINTRIEVIAKGAGSTITNAYGLYVDAQTVGGTLNRSIFVNGGISETTDVWQLCSTISIPAGGTTGKGLLFSSTANFGVFFGSGPPSLSAAQGSLYLRSDGTGTTDRAYINTNGSTTWTALTTVA